MDKMWIIYSLNCLKLALFSGIKNLKDFIHLGKIFLCLFYKEIVLSIAKRVFFAIEKGVLISHYDIRNTGRVTA